MELAVVKRCLAILVIGLLVPLLPSGENPAQAACQLDDNFNGKVLNTQIWNPVVLPTGGGTLAQTNHQVKMTIFPGAGPIYVGLQTVCKAVGDFDARIDFHLTTWPPASIHALRLAAMDLPQGPLGLPDILRASYSSEVYQFRSQSGYAQANAFRNTGTLRLVRSGSTLQGYYDEGNGFVLVGSDTTTLDPTAFAIDFSIPSTATYPGTVALAIDNFRVQTSTSSDLALVAPFNNGVSGTVVHGYNDPAYSVSNPVACNIATPLDHCANQQFGLDLQPGAGWDNNVLAPAPGKPMQVVHGSGTPCVLFQLDNGNNLNICHFASVKTSLLKTHVLQGKVLGTAATTWIHLSIDSRPTTCTGGWLNSKGKIANYFCPVQFVTPYTLEGASLPWDGSAQNQWNGHPFTSTNNEIP